LRVLAQEKFCQYAVSINPKFLVWLEKPTACCFVYTTMNWLQLKQECFFYIIDSEDSEEAVTYRRVKAQHKKLEHDFITMTKTKAVLLNLRPMQIPNLFQV